MTPSEAAFRDQLEAADSEARQNLAETIAGIAGSGDPAAMLPTLPFHRRVNRMLHAALQAERLLGRPRSCVHVDISRPSPSILLASAPERLRCRECARRKMSRQRDARCVECGTQNDLRHGQFILPHSRVIKTFGGMLTGLGGVTVHWVACWTCLEDPAEPTPGYGI
jgi:hypothetical protein